MADWRIHMPKDKEKKYVALGFLLRMQGTNLPQVTREFWDRLLEENKKDLARLARAVGTER